MVFWPKVNISAYTKFWLHGEPLKVVVEIKYLGVYIVNDLSDDVEMGKRARGIYAAGNTLISKFKLCNDACKVSLFKTYCYNVYAIALWASFRVNSYVKTKVAHNDIFRTLMQVPRYESASTLFVEHMAMNLDSISRNAMYSLMDRLLSSTNRVVKAICNSEIPLKNMEKMGSSIGS